VVRLQENTAKKKADTIHGGTIVSRETLVLLLEILTDSKLYQ
jgi:hypothetical protein